ncbi:hypothetical protein PRK78_006272 [Emydomyces testavorans]|uniref:Velvet domain-containing protein n=1 Tax=Emydomyces testavorans TaxID=2070801 RepID=A0AAF0DM43_9EURO|nr:hypothetical protein PRK78_006272 [Emydomyces testavorans]
MRKYDSLKQFVGIPHTEHLRREEVVHIKSILSKPFQVLPPKNFPGMTESTFLSRSFADQGVKLRIRKEPRTLLKRQLPRPEEYPAPLPPRYPERPTSGYPERATTSVQNPPTMNAYAQPDRDYASYYAPAPKRQRSSIDLGTRGFYDGDSRYAARALDPYSPASTTPYQGHPSNPYTQPSYHSSIPAGSPTYFDGTTQGGHPVLPSQPEHPTNGDGFGGSKYNV